MNRETKCIGTKGKERGRVLKERGKYALASRKAFKQNGAKFYECLRFTRCLLNTTLPATLTGKKEIEIETTIH